MELENGNVINMAYKPDTDMIMMEVTVPWGNCFGLSLGGYTMTDIDIIWWETNLRGNGESTKMHDGYGLENIMPYGDEDAPDGVDDWTSSSEIKFGSDGREESVKFVSYRARATNDVAGYDFEFPLDEEVVMGYAWAYTGVLSLHAEEDDGQFTAIIPSDGSYAVLNGQTFANSFATSCGAVTALVAGSLLMQLY